MSGEDFLQPVSGPAYGPVFRALATAILLAVGALASRVALQQPGDVALIERYGIVGLGLLTLAASYWVMLRSTTTIDAAGIRQSGLIERKVEWSEVHRVRVFGPKFARRLMVRTVNGRFRFFFGGSPELLAAFARIAQSYRG